VNLRDAVQLARLDWDQGLPEEAAKTDYEAALSIRGSLHLPQSDYERLTTNAWCWQDYGDAQSAAYRIVLEATEEELEALID